MGRILARKGERDAASQAIGELERLPYPPSFDTAKVHAELHSRGQTLGWLRKAEAERNSAVLSVDEDPSFASLGGDPQFGDLLRSLRLK